MKRRIPPVSKSANTRLAGVSPDQGKKLENDYLRYFMPPVSPSRTENCGFAKEPSFLKEVPTETTYGVGGVFYPISVA
jgi:hypothetical protein